MARISFDAETSILNLGPLDRWNNIPAEMKARRQWAVSTLARGADGKADKKPRRADGSEMSWRDPLQWLTFDEAVSSGFPAIGYILSAGDPFTIIDLDVDDRITEEESARQRQIYESFPSYTELSVSGRGLHIVLLGRIGGGVRRDRVEVYDQDRYMLCTGAVQTPGPIQSHPELLARLVHEMGGVSSTKELPPSGDEPCGDEELVARITNSRQGAKFQDLMNGTPSSEADAALLAILAFWTPNHDQILRIFARSTLYRPRGEADGKKGHTSQSYHEKYLMASLAGALAVRPVDDGADLEHGRQLVANLLAKPQKPWIPNMVAEQLDFPPGLVGEIAQYIYWSAPRPIKEVAIAGALAMMAGICGRQYNVSGGSGLNLYIVLLAASGMGKEAAKTGVDRLFHAMSETNPGTSVFLGPRTVSGPALEKAVSEHNPCFVTFVSEIGVRLQQMLAKRNGDPLMKAAWLGIATAAQRGRRYQGAFHSKKDDRTKDIVFPAVTIFGESTQQEYYKAISGDSFADGFVPRFLVVTHQGTEIQPLNQHMGMPPAKALLEKVCRVAQYTSDLQVREQYIEVDYPYVMEVDERYRAKATKMPEGPLRVVQTRAGLTVAKIAALLAIGEQHLRPQVNRVHLEWAMRLVDASSHELEIREASGDLSTDEDRKQPALRSVVEDLMRADLKTLASLGSPPALQTRRDLLAGRVIIKRLSRRAPFRDMERDKDRALAQALQSACEQDILQRLSEQQCKELFGKTWKGGIYGLGEAW